VGHEKGKVLVAKYSKFNSGAAQKKTMADGLLFGLMTQHGKESNFFCKIEN
jgi:hypothetical protein